MANYTTDQQEAMDKRAAEAAAKEWREDINRKDPRGVQARVDASVHAYRVSRRLERA